MKLETSGPQRGVTCLTSPIIPEWSTLGLAVGGGDRCREVNSACQVVESGVRWEPVDRNSLLGRVHALEGQAQGGSPWQKKVSSLFQSKSNSYRHHSLKNMAAILSLGDGKPSFPLSADADAPSTASEPSARPRAKRPRWPSC